MNQLRAGGAGFAPAECDVQVGARAADIDLAVDRSDDMPGDENMTLVQRNGISRYRYDLLYRDLKIRWMFASDIRALN